MWYDMLFNLVFILSVTLSLSSHLYFILSVFVTNTYVLKKYIQNYYLISSFKSIYRGLESRHSVEKSNDPSQLYEMSAVYLIAIF